MTAIVLQGSNNRAMVFGKDQTLFQSRMEFEKYLVEFLRSPTFRSTLNELGERNNEPSEGYLRFGNDPEDRDPRRDVMVGISATIQRRIADASMRGEQIEVGEFDAEVLPANATARGTLDNGPARWLASGGFFVEIVGMTPLDGKTVRLSGKTLPNIDAAA